MNATTNDLIVNIKGEIIDTNFEAFKARLKQAIASLDYALTTDEDFALAETNVKALKLAESSLSSAKERALEQAADIRTLFKEIDDISEEVRQARLSLSKQIAKNKELARSSIKNEALALLTHRHPQAEARIEEAMKNKRTMESLLLHARKEAKAINKEIAGALAILEVFKKEHGASIAYDEATLLTMEADLLTSELERRVERQRQEAEKARLRAEAQKARKEAEAAKKGSSAPETPKAPQTPTQAAPAPTKDASPKDEMERFVALVRSAFAPVKEARKALKHPENIEAANTFARALASAWTDFNSKI